MGKWYRDGTVSLQNGSKTVTGAGTQFLVFVKAGDIFLTHDGGFYEVDSVISDTELQTVDAYAGVTGASYGYAVIGVPPSVSNAALAKALAELVARWNLREDQMIAWLSGDGTVTLTDGGGTEHQVKTPKQWDTDIQASVTDHEHDDKYIRLSSDGTKENLALGWYTIAVKPAGGGDMTGAMGRLTVWDDGRDHCCHFLASAVHGRPESHNISVLLNAYHAVVFDKIRIKHFGYNAGAVVQVYIGYDTVNRPKVKVTDNHLPSPWVVKDFIPDATDPGDVTDYASMTVSTEVDLEVLGQGGVLCTGAMYAGDRSNPKRVLLDGDTLDATSMGGIAKDYYRNLSAGSTTQDPNLAVDPVIVTKHPNTPDNTGSQSFHIVTTFYASLADTANRSQIAMNYAGTTHRVYSRHYNSGVWTDWVELTTGDPMHGDIGTYAMMKRMLANSSIVEGASYAGSDLAFSGLSKDEGPRATGTWRAMGSVAAVVGEYPVTIFRRRL